MIKQFLSETSTKCFGFLKRKSEWTFSNVFQVKFKCKICGFLYSRKDTLKDHIRGKHNPRYSTTDLNSLVEVVPPSNGAIPTLNGRKN